MNSFTACVALLLVAGANPASAQDASLRAAITNGVTVCSKWVLEPNTWASDVSAFTAKLGQVGTVLAVGGAPNGVFPPQVMQSATNFFRLDAGNGNGVFVAASSTLPVCNIAAGGPSDYQPAAEALIAQLSGGTEWKNVGHTVTAEMATDTYRNDGESKAGMMISRAPKPGDRTDRVQFLATVFYEIGK